MSNDNRFKPDGRKGLPGGFVLFLLGALVLLFTFHSLGGEKRAKVSYSHEVEHLVNLDLLQPEESRKIALNDNLVTFSGKFRASLPEDANQRFQYLQLLQSNHELTADEERLLLEMAEQKKTVAAAADYFLHLSGLPLPASGYVVVSSVYDYPETQNAIVLQSLSSRQMLSLVDVEREYSRLAAGASEEMRLQFASRLQLLIQGYRSPLLGIGNEEMKKQLKDLELQVSQGASVEAYGAVLQSLREMTAVLNQEVDGMRLMPLRSVRSYKAELEQYGAVAEELSKNVTQLDKARSQVASVIWFFNNQELTTRSLEKQDVEAFSQWFAAAKVEWEQFALNQGGMFKAPDQPRNVVLDRTFQSVEPSPNYLSYFLTILPVLLVLVLLYFVFSRQMKGVGGGAMNFGKSPAKLLTKEKNKVTFEDVAGCDEAKEELQEVVEFLKDPGKFTALGARIPKGVLCVGAPGTGKTLIAKAVAGEADRPFFSISGSDFVEMFVGVGASRIRDLFDQAKKQAPCIIFMDEIDAVGRHRGAGIGGGHDEREQTLNQLLVEMDGFDTSEGVILIAATNRPDVLDKALLRPGRFDRRIVIDLPDVKGRHEILKVHARRIKLDSSVDLMHIARNTPGASGADLANILNEAALLAARRGRSAVTASEAEESCDKVRYGKERRSLEIDQSEKKTTAYHESGHAVVALCVKYADPVDKVTIIPRGLSLGATHFMPKKNRLSYWKRELLDQLAVLMGGRVAEEIFVSDISSGAQMDITQATRLVRSMVCEWGMTDALGAVAYDERSDSGQYLGLNAAQEKSYSEDTAKAIDVEVRKLIDEAHKQAIDIIESHRKQVELMTEMLMEFETLDRDDVLAIMNDTWDIEKKKQRMKLQEEASRKLPPPPPAIKEAKETKSSLGDTPGLPQGA